MINPTIYTVGGTVQAGGGIYIPRQADEELLNLCRSATFAYVLTPRQMGKSSLMVRTAGRLNDEGIQTVMIDLTQIGTQVSAEAWYLGLLTIMEDQLMLATNVVQWWQAHSHLGITQRLTLFFEKVLLVEVQERVAIFVDEIDTTLSLDFTDDFYAAIRYLYVARATNPEFQRLSCVLIGVATPGDLIRDAKRTPFNIGQRVDLTDFTFEEALPLAEGLSLPSDEAKQVLRWVLNWTGGHPYLTQRLCAVLLAQVKDEGLKTTGKSYFSNEAVVEQIVSSTFFGLMSKQDNNLQFVRDMLLKRAPEQTYVLDTYRKIRQGKPPIFDEDQSFIKSHLKLSGIVKPKHGVLCVRNLIYQEVFNNKWIKENWPAKSWTIEQKIGYGYFLAIGIACFGFFVGLVIANYYRGMENSRFNQALMQRKLLSELRDAVVGTQLSSSNLVVALENAKHLKTKKSEFLRSVDRVKQLESEITNFVDRKPKRLVANSGTLVALLQDYTTTLELYVRQIESVLQQIDNQQVQTQEFLSAREQLLKIMRSETAMRLEQLSQTISNILQNAEFQEQESTHNIEQAKIVERLILLMTIVFSTAISATVTWRISRSININSKD
ncbi:hypothetical protein BV378_22175 [Nostoc sp. RF31YmG]|nr:hypothetical protein BV378_22175 [Nostoc sp. RF31YmG]